jgi:DNA-binding CsgD family transcriptional regulator
LVVEGEAGIGKTTLWLTGIEQARGRGFRVMSAQPAETESVQAYASLADLFDDVDPAIWADLPEPQRRAVDQVLLRTESDTPATDQRAVAAAFLSVIDRLAEDSPVLLAIDDLQWLDPSTVHVVEFAARRLSGPVGILGAERTDPATRTSSWLRLARPDAMRRIQVPPLTLGGLHAVLSQRIGHPFPRPTISRIQEISGGNPFYALELARTMHGDTALSEAALPGTLAELVRARVGGLDTDVQAVLLAAACAAAPTVELIANATSADAADVVALLEEAEGSGIIGISGRTIRFTHPLLAQGVYTSASPAGRRAIHRRLAEIVEQPELKARHLALATTTFDPVTLEALDNAAEIARHRGAPAAAAELLDLAMGLGGDTPERRIRLANHHFDAGDLGRAQALLEETIAASAPGVLRAEALSLLSLVVSGDGFLESLSCLERALNEVGDNLALRVQILTTRSFFLLNVGELAQAVRNSEDALIEAERLGQPHLLSQALSMRVFLGMVLGDGLDEPSLRRALELEDRNAYSYVFLRPSFLHVLILGWTDRFDDALHEMVAIRARCLERGEETEVIVTAFSYVIGQVWRGAFADAALVAEDAMERAQQAGGVVNLMTALIPRAELAAYAGRVDEARRDAAEALEACQRGGAMFMAGWQLTILGFLEVSLGNYQAALTTLEPLIRMLQAAPGATENFVAAFVPDAVEAFVAMGRLDDAEPLIAALERNGRRLDRAWMLAIGGRCRAMVLAARGDLDGANVAAQQAMTEHDRIPMPFERARTQLLLGQLQRRGRQKDAASVALQEALLAFEKLGTPLWAERARAELGRVDIGPRRTAGLTPSEQRVAELAASGMTNRDVAAALFISPKTVEANLSRVYHKLGIRSRAELGQRVGPSNGVIRRETPDFSARGSP